MNQINYEPHIHMSINCDKYTEFSTFSASAQKFHLLLFPNIFQGWSMIYNHFVWMHLIFFVHFIIWWLIVYVIVNYKTSDNNKCFNAPALFFLEFLLSILNWLKINILQKLFFLKSKEVFFLSLFSYFKQWNFLSFVQIYTHRVYINLTFFP